MYVQPSSQLNTRLYTDFMMTGQLKYDPISAGASKEGGGNQPQWNLTTSSSKDLQIDDPRFARRLRYEWRELTFIQMRFQIVWLSYAFL